MPRKVTTSGTADLYRPNRADDETIERPQKRASRASGRVRHDEKITVYVSGEELLQLEQARLRLRAEFDVAVDRGRLVREAVGQMVDDLEHHGEDAPVVQRLRGK